MGKGAKNRAIARRTASEKDAGKMDGSPVHAFPHYPNPWNRLSCALQKLSSNRFVAIVLKPSNIVQVAKILLGESSRTISSSIFLITKLFRFNSRDP